MPSVARPDPKLFLLDPIDCPGGYQILGKTLTPFRRWADDYESHFLLRSFDTVRWVPVDEPTFKNLETQYNQGSYLPQIESIDISFKQIQELEDSTAEEVAALRRRGQEALNALGVKESFMMKAFQEKQEASKSSTKSAVQADGASSLFLLVLSNLTLTDCLLQRPARPSSLLSPQRYDPSRSASAKRSTRSRWPSSSRR